MKRLWCMWAAVALLCIGMGEGLWRVCAVAQNSFREQEGSAPEQTEPASGTPETQPTAPGNPDSGILPCPVRHTTLTVQALTNRSGPEEAQEHAALLVENTGNQGIRYFRLRIRQGEKYLYFEATCIPPGGKVLVPEQKGQAATQEPVSECVCMTLVPGEYVWNSPLVQVTNSGQFQLEVRNLSDRPLTVRIWYKAWDPDLQLLLGSDSQYVTLTQLLPGESRKVTPYGYTADYCAVVSVTAGQTQ